jgi:hypothetical protein
MAIGEMFMIFLQNELNATCRYRESVKELRQNVLEVYENRGGRDIHRQNELVLLREELAQLEARTEVVVRMIGDRI